MNSSGMKYFGTFLEKHNSDTNQIPLAVNAFVIFHAHRIDAGVGTLRLNFTYPNNTTGQYTLTVRGDSDSYLCLPLIKGTIIKMTPTNLTDYSWLAYNMYN